MQRDNDKLLKKDVFGEIRVEHGAAETRIVRDTASASAWARWLARAFLAREGKALSVLGDIPGIPEIVHLDRDTLVRTYLAGEPLHRASPPGPEYFRNAMRLLRRIHAADVAHNDLAKEPNLLVLEDGAPAFIDYQLAWYSPRRGRLFRTLGREDIRHLLKHKRTFCPDALTARERRILATPSGLTRMWRATVKPVYLFVTRRLLRWSDREGAGDRSATQR